MATFITVGWMFTALTTAATMIGWLLAWSYVSRQEADDPRSAQNFGVMMFYVTLIMLCCGAATLILGWVARRVRKKQAPASIRRAADVIGALPWAIWAVSAVFRAG
ncbi:MAG: hypothetical protein QM811_01555 [Pirellulales bacterium]